MYLQLVKNSNLTLFKEAWYLLFLLRVELYGRLAWLNVKYRFIWWSLSKKIWKQLTNNFFFHLTWWDKSSLWWWFNDAISSESHLTDGSLQSLADKLDHQSLRQIFPKDPLTNQPPVNCLLSCPWRTVIFCCCCCSAPLLWIELHIVTSRCNL